VSPEQTEERAVLQAAVLALIQQLASGDHDEPARDRLLLALGDYQRRWVVPYGRFLTQQRKQTMPALPTDAFRFARISSRAASDDVRRFRSSGTTSDERSEHALADLDLYDAAALAAARHMLFPDRERMELLIFAPPPSQLPDSSLSYMLARFVEWFGTRSTYLWPSDESTTHTLRERLHASEASGTAVALLGTSFAFVHACEALDGTRFQLPAGSRIMQTGGFKGRSRELSPDAMRAMLTHSFGVPDELIVAEYGMTELSSQLYETTLREAVLGLPRTPRKLWAPGWVRAEPVDPETLEPARHGEVGLVRIDDCANLDSVCALQTADLGVLVTGGLQLLGRASGAIARGCSITADQLLGKPSDA